MEYYRRLDALHQHVVPRTYVEIGLAEGDAFAVALPGTMCVGIDPHPTLAAPLPFAAHIVEKTSDEFFATEDLDALLDGVPVDLAFVDGMHLVEFVVRDFLNLEPFCTPESLLVFHDCLPSSEIVASRERQTVEWTGDVWKFVLWLDSERPDLEYRLVDTPPSGLLLVKNAHSPARPDVSPDVPGPIMRAELGDHLTALKDRAVSDSAEALTSFAPRREIREGRVADMLEHREMEAAFARGDSTWFRPRLAELYARLYAMERERDDLRQALRDIIDSRSYRYGRRAARAARRGNVDSVEAHLRALLGDRSDGGP